ncbi:MAG: outer membrane lipid asymmetry maintenance protein MlaD [Proteobacteria bacterium]|nr:outer membrane lipid asymmetry maintenance protein MlaD [Desulfobacula sp.]MBU4130220.1 outer membrane lipid asymmetry maintenance protein MlaD [Pseudomonadota bacterium]
MDKRKIELYVGMFVIAGLISIGYLVISIGEFRYFSQDRYSVYGYFSSVSGLKDGARVEIAGVEIGNVSKISIDRERLLAKVVFSINREIELSEDSIASVKTSGIIGQKYIDISPGGSDDILGDGDKIDNTESSLNIESLVRKFIFANEKP